VLCNKSSFSALHHYSSLYLVCWGEGFLPCWNTWSWALA
jgi:hypothetical protein